MRRNTSALRVSLTLLLLAGLFFGAVGQSLARGEVVATVNAPLGEVSKLMEPLLANDELNIVISEFRFLGPEGGNDEFIELFNPTNKSINISGWKIMESNNAGETSLRSTLGSVTLSPGQHYLLVNQYASASLLALKDVTYATGITDDGGIALTLANETTIIDAVGLSSGSAYKEGTILIPLSGTANQSYERKTSGNVSNCNDTNNNVGDFVRNSTSSNPQNLSSALLACITVTNVSSTNGTYIAGNPINVNVEFSQPVNVTGTPRLLLETGVTDGYAIFSTGSGNKILTFVYIVEADDYSNDLDYVSAYALSLNGGSITGAIGDATLILPKPGTIGSLGDNNDIVIDNGVPPSTVSFKRQSPASTPTNSDTLTFRITFSKAMLVSSVNTNDFAVTGATGTTTTLTVVNGSVYDLVISGGDLDNYNGVVGLNFSSNMEIKDPVGALLPLEEPLIDEVYTVDNIVPTVTVNQASGQADPTNIQPVVFTVVFSEAIDVTTFTTSDITQSGTAPYTTWSITDSGDQDPKTFTLSAMVSGDNLITVIPTIAGDKVKDPAGNGNAGFMSIGGCGVVQLTGDNCVNLNATVAPTVNITLAPGQLTPTSALPIRFAIAFSEPINTSVFNVSDITQKGTATGITWSISDSGDHTNFILSATASGYGTLKPFIDANRVLDLVGNSNLASNQTATVSYFRAAPTFTFTPTITRTPTITPTPTALKTVIISEIGWMGTSASSSDEWIELFNTTNHEINLDGWHLRSFRYDGEDFKLNLDIVLANVKLQPRTSNEPRDPSGYYLLETRENAVIFDNPSIEPQGQTYSGSLYNSGEILLLCSSLSHCNINTKRQTVDFVNATLSTTGNIMPWAAGSSSTYGSMERKDLANDEPTSYFTHIGESPRWGKDANGNAIKGTPGHPNWAFTVTSTPRATATITRTPTRSPLPAPFVVINEVLARSGSDWNNDGRVDVYDEFIEVINSGTVDVNLSGYKLDDYELDESGKLLWNGFTLPSQTLKPGEIAVFYGSQTGIHLEDAGDTVFLMRTSNSSVVDQVTYPIAKSLDSSMCRYTDAYGSWIVGCFPTPGLANMLTGNRFPSTSNGQPIPVCVLPDSVPDEFALAECEEGGLGIWNYSYWDSFPGEGDQIWQSDERDKWLVIYQ